MSLRITARGRNSPAPCDHYTFTVDADGEEITFQASGAELDEIIEGMSTADFVKLLTLLWCKYRKDHGRGLVGTDIA